MLHKTLVLPQSVGGGAGDVTPGAERAASWVMKYSTDKRRSLVLS